MRSPVCRILLVCGLALVSSHRVAAQATTTNPHGTLPQQLDCTSCHTNESWKTMRTPLAFDHDRQTRFPLVGQHARASCLSCHLSAKFDEPKLTSNDCATCHVDVHQGNLGRNCEACHTPTRFREVNGVGLHVRTGFPLTGAHLQLACAACHRDSRNGSYTSLNSECIACHQKDYTGSTVVDHVAAGFSIDCRRCHSDLTWHGGVQFDHLTASTGKFALLGAHAQLRCASCHIPPSGTLKWTPASQSDCVACHQTAYAGAHGGSGFPTSCADCHTVSSWNSDFNHGTATNGNFVLTGAHVSLACTKCHTPGTFTPIWNASGGNDCVACHQTQYDQNHTGSGFPTSCLTCHTTSRWSGATFTSHDAQYFPIYSGAHRGQWGNNCATCHTAPTDYSVHQCLSCHAKGTSDASHAAVVGYLYTSQACYGCHPRGTH